MESSQEPEGQSGGAASGQDDTPQTVRFASVNQEIEPFHSLQSPSPSSKQISNTEGGKSEEDEAMRKLALELHSSHLHQRRMSNFTFEPCSLPVSRAPSNESTPYHSSREQTRSGGPSPKTSPPASAMTTPPLTPHGTHPTNTKKDDTTVSKLSPEAAATAVRPASSPKPSSKTIAEASSGSLPISQHSTGDQGSTRPTSVSQQSSTEDARAKPSTGFSIGPSGSISSASESRDPSPAGKPTDQKRDSSAPPVAPRPHTPLGDRDDPYARSKRPPQPRNLDSIDARFKFGSTDARRRSGVNAGSVDHSYSSLPPTNAARDNRSEHRKSTFSLLGGKEHHSNEEKNEKHDKPHGSMSDLKRFFGLGAHHHKVKRGASPAPSARGSIDKSGFKTPPRHNSSIALPFADDHGLEQKYGKFNKLLGSGAGGSVRLMKRASDGRTFAVKQFRDRHNYESVRDYNKKVTAEFCIGSTLHHGNIIETLDIIQEGGHWYEVMEYAPYDLFAIVMTGKMSREEITCCFLQIVSGVTFLHSSGLAHRDLKLDNVVVNEFGIMKIIDFGSASVFKYPFENDIMLASGVVGSDPYLAPEVYDERKYDPQPADIWSLAIIFACMSLRRFPWKAPRLTDNSFKLFVSEPNTNMGGDAAERPKANPPKPPSNPSEGGNSDAASTHSHHHHHHHHHHDDTEKSGTDTQIKDGEPAKSNTGASTPRNEPAKPEVIKGPWRLLRLLPRETRSIIEQMLKVDPHKRATLATMQADPWIKNAPVCQQLDHGKVARAGTHTHILEPGSSTPAPSAKQ